jgi:hypothetical protein
VVARSVVLEGKVMAWQSQIVAMDDSAVISDSFQLTVRFYDDANPNVKTFTKTYNFMAGSPYIESRATLRAFLTDEKRKLRDFDNIKDTIRGIIGQDA